MAVLQSGGIGFLPANTEIADGMFWFHNSILLPVITGISLLVLALIVYIVWRFNETANPVPSRRTHNAVLEFAWTVAARAHSGHHSRALVPAARASSSSFPRRT